jgi:uncharacterized repeat protein (TIGR01451 family)
MPIDLRKVFPMAAISLLACTAMMAAVGGAPAAASAQSAVWAVSSSHAPTSLQPGGTATYVLTATNVGTAPADGGASQIAVIDTLPVGASATAIIGVDVANSTYLQCELQTLTCTDPAVVPPGDELIVQVTISISAIAPASIVNTVNVTGGEAPSASTLETATVGATRAGFGFQSFTGHTNNADGSVDTAAGDHPYSATTSFTVNTVPSGNGGAVAADQDVKDLAVNLPAGFLGDPSAVPQCPRAVFALPVTNPTAYVTEKCPIDSQVGAATVVLTFGASGAERDVYMAPVYNVAPEEGEPATFGFTLPAIAAINVSIPAHVRTGGDYGVTATVSDVSELEEVLSTSLTLWGVPGDHAHDAQRGDACSSFLKAGGLVQCPDKGGHSFTGPVKPFLTNPTDCAQQAQAAPVTTITGDSWQNPGAFTVPVAAASPPVTGCDLLRFSPSLSLTPETAQADTPTGLGVDLQVPQTESPNTLATPELKDATVALPAGLAVSPSAANGLQACSDEQIALSSPAAGSCPQASKISSVQVHTPLLEHTLPGALYLGTPLCAPCTNADAQSGRMLRLFIEVDDAVSGVIVKLAGTVSANPSTGRLTATFKNNPQLPFSDLKLRFKGGPRAPLATPQSCGTFTTTSDLEPWSAPETPDATPSSSFAVSWDGAGAACPASPPFAPSFNADTTVPLAGAFSPFTLTLARADREQDLAQVQIHMPPGLLGTISNVPLCGEPEAGLGTCSQASRIGTTTVAAGPGSNPFYLSGPVYLTGPYHGAPFGLSVVVPALAGPFNLGTVVVRAAITIDPNTAAVTVTSGALPQIIDGVPVRLRTVNVTVDRPGFVFNPTDCAEQAVTGAVASTQGATAALSDPFAVGGCRGLPFKPKLRASTQARTSKANGASLTVKVASSPGQTNIAKVDLQLPNALPSRLTTLQKACTEAQFNADPAGCPQGSVIGTASAVTPVLNVALAGPAILVSQGGAAFPDVEFVLQGEGVTVVLDGKTEIRKGVTYSHFDTVPDAPFSSFETVLPEGPHSILAAYLPARAHGSLCSTSLVMPATITGQNGAVLKQLTKLEVTGCKKPRHRQAGRVGRHAKGSNHR